jgi:serine/threonine protein kinase
LNWKDLFDLRVLGIKMNILTPNTVLQNRYLIVQLIGKGGMGEVYLAIDQRLGSTVALKRTILAGEENINKAFGREAKILARLRHPALPKVSDHFTENDLQYLVMEHISGDDLSQRLEITKKPFSLNWVLFWADQLLDALAYLHSHNPPIIHRDIKPHNLKLTDDNQIVLLDFGLVKNTIGETRLSVSGSLSGFTPNYASMEQIRGTGTTAQSDIYSLAVTLYHLLTNVVPPDALTRADSLISGAGDPTIPINVLNPAISSELSDAILIGMNLSMEHRYREAREMQNALREFHSPVSQSFSIQNLGIDISESPNISNVYPNKASANKSQLTEVSPSSNNDIETHYPLQSNNNFSPTDNDSDITIQVIHFKGIDTTQVDSQHHSSKGIVLPPKTDSVKVASNPKLLVAEKPVKIAPKTIGSSKKWAFVSAIFGCVTIGIVLGTIALYSIRTFNSADSMTVTQPVSASVEATVSPSIEITNNANSLPTDQAGFNSSNTSITTVAGSADTTKSINDLDTNNATDPTKQNVVSQPAETEKLKIQNAAKTHVQKSKSSNEPTPVKIQSNPKQNTPKPIIKRDPSKVF